MNGRRFAFEFGGGNDWTPPWLREEPSVGRGPMGGPGGPRGPRMFAMRFGRHPFGPHGHHGPFGPGEGGRFFGRGDVKFALLELLQERPMHGYEMMKALEEKSGGFYTPSPGSIYPTLQMLEDRGFVTVQEAEGKKVYSITAAGQALLTERQQGEREFAGPPWMRMREFGQRGNAPEMQALRSETMEVMRLFAIASRKSFTDPKQLVRLRSVLERTRKDLSDLIYNTAPQQDQTSSSASIEPISDPSDEQA
jgi:DNA-binding PadR family transcriptional regulator